MCFILDKDTFFYIYSYEKCDFLHVIPMKNVIFKWVNQQKTAIEKNAQDLQEATNRAKSLIEIR